MSVIEQAGRRLAQLQQAGVRPPELREAPPQVPAPAVAAAAGTGAAPRSRAVTIDLRSLKRAGLITPDSQRSALAEQLRAIKRPLLVNARNEGAAPVRRGNCVMVTSSVAGEGKTFTALNLALSIAMEVDVHVLLVDADVVRPAVMARLGLPEERGLMDLVIDPALPLQDVLLRSNLDKLSLLPAGKPQPNATELLASESMRRLIDDLATRYSDRIVIFDAPPLLQSNESRVLATQMGQIVVVVEAEHTAQRTLVEAMETIEDCPVVMTLLNKSRHRHDQGRYGYYGGV